jgi:hypothetical protein
VYNGVTELLVQVRTGVPNLLVQVYKAIGNLHTMYTIML